MAKYRMICILLILFTFFIDTQAVLDYGPFNLTITDLKLCKGPKRRDCSTYSGNVINGTQMVYDVEVLENIGNIEGNIVTASKKNKWKLPLKKICDHTFWKPFVETHFDIKNCVIQKGKYHVEINFQDLVQKYYGGSFIYGKWTIKAMFYNNFCNFGCTITELLLSPKKI